MPPAAFKPSTKPLSGRYLSRAEHEEIALLLVQGRGVREIARRLGRAASTISRQLRRNAATRSGNFDYRATTVQWHAELAARRFKIARLSADETLRCWVDDRLNGVVAKPGAPSAVAPPVASWKGRRHGPRQNRRRSTAWSPEQIAGRLPINFPDYASMRRDLTACLRSDRALRMPKARAGAGRARRRAFELNRNHPICSLMFDEAELAAAFGIRTSVKATEPLPWRHNPHRQEDAGLRGGDRSTIDSEHDQERYCKAEKNAMLVFERQ